LFFSNDDELKKLTF